jgi:hypothetical protein
MVSWVKTLCTSLVEKRTASVLSVELDGGGTFVREPTTTTTEHKAQTFTAMKTASISCSSFNASVM